MSGWLFPPLADRQLLPGGRLRGPTPLVIAIMTFAMMIVAAAGLALSNAAGIVAAGADNRFAIQVPGGGDLLPRAIAAARSAPGVVAVEPVPEAEMRKTIERWLGPAGAADIPVPGLVDLDVAPGTDIAALSRRIEQAAPGARFVAHRETLEPILASMRALQWLALALVALMAAATAASIVLAARGALDTNRSTIEVMHGIGATDLQVTRLFQRKIALDAAVGSLVGGAAAALVLLATAGGGAGAASDIAGGQPLRARDFAILAILPIIAIALATWVARTAVLAALRRST